MRKNGHKPKQKPKPEKQHHPLPQGPRLHRIIEIPREERGISPPPRPTDSNCCLNSMVVLVFLAITAALCVVVHHIVFHDCSNAEKLVHRNCIPELDKLKILTNMTIPDFSMTPIGQDIAEKCAVVEECLNAIDCPKLYCKHSYPDRCLMYTFFHRNFKQCREKLRQSKNIPKCVKQFLVAGPIPCDVLNRHISCYKRQILEICDDVDEDFKSKFKDNIKEYRQIIQCFKEEDDDEDDEF